MLVRLSAAVLLGVAALAGAASGPAQAQAQAQVQAQVQAQAQAQAQVQAGTQVQAPVPAYADAELESALRWQRPDPGAIRDDAEASRLMNSARRAASQGRWGDALQDAREAMQAGADLYAAWMLISRAQQTVVPEYSWERESNLHRAAVTAYGAYGVAETDAERAAALALLATAEAQRGRYTEAERAFRTSLALDPRTETQAALAAFLEAHPFAPAGLTADAERDRPRICVAFTRELLPADQVDYSDYIRVSPAIDRVIDVGGSELCIEGARHGATYTVTVRPGLTAATGSRTATAASDSLTVPDREPQVGFRGEAYVLPRVGSRGVPVVTVNRDSVELALLRITDRNMVEEINRERLGRGLHYWQLNALEEERAEEVWRGVLETPGEPNRETVTAFPIGEVLDAPEPGIYVLSAETGQPYTSATQWVLVSDLGLVTYRGADGLTVIANSLETGAPVGGVALSLYSRSNRLLGTAETDAEGVARLAAGLLRGSFAAEPVALTAVTEAGDYTVIDLTQPAFDLSDRGVAGRPYPGPVDAFLYTERGIYRPGETVHLAALLRDSDGRAATGLPATLRLFRPDGVEARRIALPAAADGAGSVAIPIDSSAPTGQWSVAAHLDPDADPVGGTSFQVEDFVPPTVEFDLAADAPAVTPGEPLEITVDARFLYGAPASGLRGEAELVLSGAPLPFPALSGYRFGLVQEEWLPQRVPLAVPETDSHGRATIAYRMPVAPDTSLPLQAQLRVTLFEDGGRAVNRRLTLPVRPAEPMVGVRPLFAEGRVSYESEAGFEVVAVAPDGSLLRDRELVWELYEEVYDYFWYSEHGRWSYRVTQRDRRIDDGALRVEDGVPARLGFRQGWGNYRLEVADAEGNAVTSQRFAVGWSAAPVLSSTPDKMGVALDRDRYRPGDTATLRLEAPFAGEAVIAVLNDGVRAVHRVTVPETGGEFALPVGDWEAGAYVTVTALRPAGAESERGPARAVGLAWLAMDRAPRTLAVEIDAPRQVQPRQVLAVPVQVAGTTGAARLTLAAVDDAVLQLTGYRTPDPAGHYFGKRRLAVEIRDLYGRLIDGHLGAAGTIRSGGDMGGENLAALGKRSSRVVALFSGLVELDADGRAEVSLDIPDFNGRLRLMAVALDAQSIGSGQVDMLVRDPVVADVSLPRFLAPGDRAEVQVSLTPLDAPAGRYEISLAGDGNVVAADGGAALELAQGARGLAAMQLDAGSLGDGTVRLRVDGPDGLAIEREWDLSVRPADAFTTRSVARQLAPGQSVTADADILDGLLPDGARASLTVSGIPAFDIAGLLQQLDRYPYGCLEQTVSRALPLLYLSGVASRVGAAPEEAGALAERLEGAVRRVLAMQRPDGSFGLWSSAGATDEWLSGYALDFLTRARELGHPVDGFAYGQGLAWLQRSVASGDFTLGQLPARAYAHYVLALAGTAEVSDLRHFADTYLEHLPTRLAKAQLGAALARFGDAGRADRAFAAASGHREAGSGSGRAGDGRAGDGRDWRFDTYGSELRDQAALLTLATASGRPWAESLSLGERVVALWQRDRWVSTQEMSWMLLAAHAMLERAGPLDVALDGEARPAVSGTLDQHLDRESLARGVTLTNRGTEPVTYVLSASGFPEVTPPPVQRGFSLTRRVFTRDGAPAGLETVTQNDVYVVVLEGAMAVDDRRDRRALIVDLLPAGFELENAALGGALTGDLSWLPPLSGVAHMDLRDDRFVAQADLSPDNASFAVAYLMRAVTPGEYAVPAAFVEDMYDPGTHARGEAGRSVVRPAR